MKQLKLIGIAAVAAMALMALAAGPASAKVCSTSITGSGCGASSGEVYTGAFSTALTAGKKATLTSGFITVTCTTSTKAGNITNGATGAANLTSLTFSGCTNNINGGACTASTTASAANPWPATLTTTTAPNAMTTAGTSAIPVSGELACNILGANRTCIYASNSAALAFNGGTPAMIDATNVALTLQAGSDSLCSSTATWSGNYSVTSPTNLTSR